MTSAESSSVEVKFAFTEASLALLRKRLAESETAEDFFANVDEIAQDPANLVRLSYSISVPESLDPKDDATSSLLLHEAIGEIDRANAADIRLWSYLALVPFRNYMKERWPLEGLSSQGAEKFRGVTSERWLLITASRRGLIRHGIARLWWVASLSYDPMMERKHSSARFDPYYYTKWFFENQNRIQSLLERQLGSSSKLLWPVIEVAADFEAGNQSELIKKITKELFAMTAYRRLELLKEEEIQEIVRGTVSA